MNFEGYPLEPVREAGKHFETPFYLYNLDILETNIETLRQATQGFKLRYAVKTNPNPMILNWMKNRVDSVDVSSSGEIILARKQGWQGCDIEFTGPAKTAKDLQLALREQIHSIVIEDLSEAELLNDIARQQGVTARILIRIAPALAEENFGVRLAGRPTQFGVDEDKLPQTLSALQQLTHLHLAGFHIYSGSQCLNDESLANHFANMWAIFQQAMQLWSQPIEELVFGAGMGIPYHDSDNSLKLTHLPAIAQQIREDIASRNLSIECFIEVGRFLIGTAGLFVTRVVRVKESKNTLIAICDGGMNHNLGACGHLGGISHRHYSMINLTGSDKSVEKYRIVGPLCTAIDTLAHRIEMPKISTGDLLAIGCAGSYGPTASPLFFISHALPTEILYTQKEQTNDGFIQADWLTLPQL
ncbi:alanine racemase [Gynuella sunshinyii]|uniref:Diaminopimelate decarboxylase n=1 Tax=Gynuella sunshinyii YC6258 TaxID=1445510 RepID=A0A0C5VHW4_9GAMM|nr:alanine racemase [Gynuella sunshinyii]AJQ93846.1 diaminopimelate decarboxylase [Gynuella sunshinyii YC6258]